MQKKPLTERQRYWLDHIQTWNEPGMRMSEYARDQNFPVRAMYDAKKALVKKGTLSEETNCDTENVGVAC